VWAHTDREVANGAPDDLRECRERLTDAARRLRRSQDLLWSCIYASDLPWASLRTTYRVVSVDPSGRPR